MPRARARVRRADGYTVGTVAMVQFLAAINNPRSLYIFLSYLLSDSFLESLHLRSVCVSTFPASVAFVAAVVVVVVIS